MKTLFEKVEAMLNDQIKDQIEFNYAVGSLIALANNDNAPAALNRLNTLCTNIEKAKAVYYCIGLVMGYTGYGLWSELDKVATYSDKEAEEHGKTTMTIEKKSEEDNEDE